MSGITNFVPDDALRQPSMLLPHSSKDLEAQQGILRLLIAEPIPALRSYFSQVVRKAISQDVDIIELDKSLDLATQAESLAFELLVFDLDSSDIGGLNLAQRIWTASPRTKILFWCQRHREARLARIAKMVPKDALYGYILKSQSEEQFVFAIQCLLAQNNSYIDPSVRQDCVDRHKLSAVEYETLRDIGLGLTDKTIALRNGVSTRTIQYRIAAVFAKVLRLDEKQDFDSLLNGGFLNARVRVMLEAFRQGLIDFDEIDAADDFFRQGRNLRRSSTGAGNKS